MGLELSVDLFFFHLSIQQALTEHLMPTGPYHVQAQGLAGYPTLGIFYTLAVGETSTGEEERRKIIHRMMFHKVVCP